MKTHCVCVCFRGGGGGKAVKEKRRLYGSVAVVVQDNGDMAGMGRPAGAKSLCLPSGNARRKRNIAAAKLTSMRLHPAD